MNASIIARASVELDQLQAQGGNAPVPPCCRVLIRSLPGNATCVDCGAPHPEWANITMGSLICLQCSGRHRSYGVGTSVIRSLTMDHVKDVTEILKMLEGGNGQLQSFFDRHELGQTCSSANRRYHTKAAKFYRRQMAAHVTALAARGSYQGRDASRQHYRKQTTAAAVAVPTTPRRRRSSRLSNRSRRLSHRLCLQLMASSR